jgi:hypothetical protein
MEETCENLVLLGGRIGANFCKLYQHGTDIQVYKWRKTSLTRGLEDNGG